MMFQTRRLWALVIAVSSAMGLAGVLLIALNATVPVRAAGETVQFSATSYSVAETGGTAVVTLTISPAPTATITVTLASADNTATSPADYTALNQTLNINAGVTETTFAVTINDDSLYEGNETLALTVSYPDGVVGPNNPATLTIVENESQPTVQFSDSSYSVAEDGGPATITATLSGASALPVSAQVTSANGSALSASDYAPVSAPLSFAPTVTQVTVTVAITDDALFEGDETLSLSLSSPVNTTVGSPNSATLTITDDETQPTVALDSSTYGVSEGAGSLTVGAALSGASATPVTVVLSTTNGTAGASDYTPVNTTLTFPANTTVTNTTIALNDDALDENNETFGVQLSSPSGASLGSPINATATITDNDNAPSVSLSAAAQTVDEGDGVVTVTANLSAVSGLNVSVPFTVGGTATAADHDLTGGTINIPAGQSNATVTFNLTNDTLDEDNETVIVTLGTPTNASLGSTTVQTITLTDNDDPPSISIGDVTVTEGNSGSLNATFTVTLSAASGRTVTVNYATANGTATTADGDYLSASGVLTFTAGDTSETFNVTVNGDARDEGASETFLVNLTSPSNATLADGSAVGTITDDDDPPSIAISDATVTEGDSGTTTASFDVSLSAASGLQVTVNYATTNGTATTADGDYVAATGVITFTPGDTTETISITVNGDTRDEGASETFNVTLSSPSNASLGDGSAVGTITDDDAPPAISIGDVTVAEGNSGTTSASFSVSLSAVSGLQVTVNYATTNNTATTADGDYVGATGVITFTPGDSSEIVLITVNGDTRDEGASETFNVVLSAPTNATFGDSTGVGTITDDDPQPSASLSAATQSVDEGDGVVTVTVNLSAISGLNVNVPFTVGGTATGGSTDHNLADGSFSVPAGSSSGNVTFTVTDDALDENSETVIVTLGTPTNASLGATTQQTITINDNDPTPAISINDVSVTEAGDAIFNVTLSSLSSFPVSATYLTENGTAVQPSDYITDTGTVNFPPGVSTQSITITTVGDLLDEPNETFRVNLSNPTNATLADAQGQGTILDDDPTPSLSINSISVTEGTGGTVNAVFTVTLSAASGQAVSVNYATADITATAGSDYTAASGMLNFAPGTTSQAITITVQSDALDEENETFSVNLSGAINATLGAASGTGTILDDDLPPTLTLANASLTESNSSQTLTFTATLSAASGRTLSVNYATADDTALAGQDYTATSGTLSFAAGQLTRTITVTVLGDALDEATETFDINLSSPQNVSLAATQATGTIVDDDPTPNARFSAASQAVSENVGTVNVTVELTATSGSTVNVPFTVGGTATGADHTLVAGSVSIAPGATSTVITFTVTNDALDETDETVILTLGTPTGANLGSPSVHTVTINDNDNPPDVALTAATYSVTENAGPLVVTATLTAPSGVQVTVNYSTTNGTALAGSDYTGVTGVLTFSAGTITQTFTVPIAGDTTFEPDETFTIALSGPVNAGLGSPGSATVTIANDDPAPTMQFAQATYTVIEDTAGVTNTASITVTLSNPTYNTAAVSYTTSAGTATAGADYVNTSGTLTFTPGQTSQTFTVSTVPDILSEPGGDETVSLTLSNAANATLTGTNPATLNIVDNDGIPTVRFSTSAQSVNESAGSAPITVTLSNPSINTITVTITSTNGTATAGVDYAAVNRTVTFPSGNTVQTFTVPITNETLYENDETFVLALSNPLNATLGSSNITQTVTIANDDLQPTATLSAASSVGEGAGSISFTVNLSNPSAFITSVDFATSNGTATAGSDYTTNSGTLTFAPGDQSEAFSVTILSDSTYEGNETFNVNFSNRNGIASGPSNTTITITEDDAAPAVQFNTSSYSVSEGAASATITVTLTGNSSAVTTNVNYGTSSGTATAGSDFATTSGTLSFPAGTTSLTFTVPVLADSTYEGNEALALNLSAPVSATLGSPSSSTLTILENDPAPTIQFSVAADDVSESGGSYVVTVNLSGNRSVPASVSYATSNGTATADLDYTATSGSLSFPVGTTSLTFTVPILNDAIYESDETFTVTLSAPVSSTLGANSNLGITINNDEAKPTVQLTSGSYVAGENAGTMTLTATLSHASAFVSTVNYATSNGSALAGTDYNAVSGTLTFNPGDTLETFTITLPDDSLYENFKSFSIALSSPSGIDPGPTTSATFTIANDDARVGCAIYDSSNVPLAIPDNNMTGVESVLTLPGPGVVITDVSVRIESLQHSYMGDLRITLIGPDNTSVVLLANNGAGPNLTYTVFNDTLGDSLLGAQPPFTGVYKPNTVLPALGRLNGKVSATTWRLQIVDTAAADVGTLRIWGLELCGPTAPTHTVYLPVIRK